jgi:hypothetical protein
MDTLTLQDGRRTRVVVHSIRPETDVLWSADWSAYTADDDSTRTAQGSAVFRCYFNAAGAIDLLRGTNIDPDDDALSETLCDVLWLAALRAERDRRTKRRRRNPRPELVAAAWLRGRR